MNDYERASRGGGYPDRPGFKARATSREAAEAIVGAAKSIRARVFEALKASPWAEGLGETFKKLQRAPRVVSVNCTRSS